MVPAGKPHLRRARGSASPLRGYERSGGVRDPARRRGSRVSSMPPSASWTSWGTATPRSLQLSGRAPAARRLLRRFLSAMQPCLDSTADIRRKATFAPATCRTGVGLAHLLAHWPVRRAKRPCESAWSVPALALESPAQQKTPRRGGEAFLGLLQGGEICISIYVDLWEVGGPLMCRGRIDGSRSRHMGGAEPSQEVLCATFQSVSLNRSFNQSTNIRAICV